MSFTKYYFDYGYNTTMEKFAKDKEEGMGLGAKLGLGALGAAGLGAGAYYSPEILGGLSDLAKDNLEPGMMSHSLYSGLGDAANWAQEHVQDPMREAAAAGLEGGKDLLWKAKNAIAGGAGSKPLADMRMADDTITERGVGALREFDNAALEEPSALQSADDARQSIMSAAQKAGLLARPAAKAIDTGAHAVPESWGEVWDNTTDYWEPRIQKAVEALKNQVNQAGEDNAEFWQNYRDRMQAQGGIK